MAPHVRKLKIITFDLGGEEFAIQVRKWTVKNDTEDGEKAYTFGPDGEYTEEADADWKLELELLADWRATGISDFLWNHDGEVVTFQVDHHPDIALEHVRWTGSVTIKAPSVGGEARTTEITEITLPILGKPEYERV